MYVHTCFFLFFYQIDWSQLVQIVEALLYIPLNTILFHYGPCFRNMNEKTSLRALYKRHFVSIDMWAQNKSFALFQSWYQYYYLLGILNTWILIHLQCSASSLCCFTDRPVYVCRLETNIYLVFGIDFQPYFSCCGF